MKHPERPFNGNRLRQLRELNRFSLAELAKAVGETKRVIAALEANQSQPTSELEQDLAMLLGFPIAFFHREDPPNFPMGSLLWHYPTDQPETTKKPETESIESAENVSITIDGPPEGFCPWGHKPIIEIAKGEHKGMSVCTVCGERFYPR